MSIFFKFAMYFTSFTPLWISVILVDTISLINGVKNYWSEVLGIVTILVGLAFSTHVIYTVLKKVDHTEYQNYILCEVVREKGITSEFLLSYVLPLFVFDFTRWTDLSLFLIYFFILSFLCIRNNNVYVNIFFELKRYKFFSCVIKDKVEEQSLSIEAIIISKTNLSALKNNTIRALPLNKPFYVSE